MAWKFEVCRASHDEVVQMHGVYDSSFKEMKLHFKYMSIAGYGGKSNFSFVHAHNVISNSPTQ